MTMSEEDKALVRKMKERPGLEDCSDEDAFQMLKTFGRDTTVATQKPEEASMFDKEYPSLSSMSSAAPPSACCIPPPVRNRNTRQVIGSGDAMASGTQPSVWSMKAKEMPKNISADDHPISASMCQKDDPSLSSMSSAAPSSSGSIPPMRNSNTRQEIGSGDAMASGTQPSVWSMKAKEMPKNISADDHPISASMCQKDDPSLSSMSSAAPSSSGSIPPMRNSNTRQEIGSGDAMARCAQPSVCPMEAKKVPENVSSNFHQAMKEELNRKTNLFAEKLGEALDSFRGRLDRFILEFRQSMEFEIDQHYALFSRPNAPLSQRDENPVDFGNSGASGYFVTQREANVWMGSEPPSWEQQPTNSSATSQGYAEAHYSQLRENHNQIQRVNISREEDPRDRTTGGDSQVQKNIQSHR